MVDISEFKSLINNLFPVYHTDDATHNKINAFFIVKGLLKSDNVKNKNVYSKVVGLTEKGITLMGKII